MESPSKVQVQHVTKASSDQLLRKFAEMDSCSDTEETRKSTSKRRRLGRKKKTTKKNNVLEEEEVSPSKENVNSNLISGSFRKIEKKSLLPNKRNNRRSSGGFVRQLGISRSYVRNCRNKFVLGAIEKTWNKAIKGASKVFMEKHYNRHRILNKSDMV